VSHGKNKDQEGPKKAEKARNYFFSIKGREKGKTFRDRKTYPEARRQSEVPAQPESSPKTQEVGGEKIRERSTKTLKSAAAPYCEQLVSEGA